MIDFGIVPTILTSLLERNQSSEVSAVYTNPRNSMGQDDRTKQRLGGASPRVFISILSIW